MYGPVGRSSCLSAVSNRLPPNLFKRTISQRVHPYLIHTGHLLVPTFGVLAALGLMAALTLSLRTARMAALSPDKLWDAGLFLLLAAFVLSRFLLIVQAPRAFATYPLLLLMLPSLTPAGIALTFVAAIIYLRRKDLPLLSTLDAWAPGATLLWSFLSLGHLAQGTDAGLPTMIPWGMRIFPDPLLLHPVALYAAAAAAILTLVLLRHLARRIQPGTTAALALVAAGTIQFLLTFFRQPYPYAVPLGRLLDPIQWIALGMIVTAGVLYLLSTRKPVSDAV